MKKSYDGLDLEVVLFDDEDVITASGGGCTCDDVKVVTCPPDKIPITCPPDGIPITCPPQSGCGCNCPMAEAVCRIT